MFITCRHLSRCCMFVFMFSELFQKLGGMLVPFACSVVFNLFVNYVGNCSHLGCHHFLKYFSTMFVFEFSLCNIAHAHNT